jgi:site-specific DNA recombinase
MTKTNQTEYKRAVIYCRVSSEQQVTEGTGLDSQEQRCLKYALDKGLSIAKIFREEGVSGGLFDRPAMQNLIDFLDMHADEKFVVIFDDLKRFARDVEVHLKLRTELVGVRKAKLECLNFNFEDTPEGQFVEILMAATAQLERQQNKRQVIQKQKARLEGGFWSFHAPPGLKFIKDASKGKVLVPSEPYATIYKDAIELFVNYKLNTLGQVRDYILNQYKIYNINRPLSLNGVTKILNCPLYAGYIEYQPWGIPLRKAHHQGFITPEMLHATQQKLSNSSKPRLRKDYRSDFPLRNYVTCPACLKAMTGSWHKGRSGIRYAHYWCKTDGCDLKNKTLQRDRVEKDFKKLVKKIIPSSKVLDMSSAILKELWEEKSKQADQKQSGNSMEIKTIDKQIAFFMERITEATTPTVISYYESEIEKLSNNKVILESALARQKYTNKQFIEATTFVFDKLKNPQEQWASPNYFDQRTFLNLYFENGLTYDREKGFSKTKLPVIIEIANRKGGLTYKSLVEMAGVKPASKRNQLKN